MAYDQPPDADTGVVRMERYDKRQGRKVVKDYQTVPLRIKNFWADPAHKGWSILTKILSRNEETVLVRCRIYNETGTPVATGHAEEIRGSSDVNSTSAVENAETSAIGRALAALGLGGTSFASAEEVAGAVAQQDNFGELKKFFLPLFESAARVSMKYLGDCWAKPELLKEMAPDTWHTMHDEEGKPKFTAIEVKRALQSELPRLKEIASRAAHGEPPDAGA